MSTVSKKQRYANILVFFLSLKWSISLLINIMFFKKGSKDIEITHSIKDIPT